MSALPRSPARRRLALLALLAGCALAAFLGIQLLPTGSRLGHMDFRPRGGPLIQCDPTAPQFVPVKEVPSPVTMTLEAAPASAGRPLALGVRLRSASGRPVGPSELLEYHTQLLHLLVIGPDLGDYQHLHPAPGAEEGAWETSFTPRGAGSYRIFADFLPRATGRPLYAVADLEVAAGGLAVEPVPTTDPMLQAELLPVTPVQPGRSFTLELRLHRTDGAPCILEPVMGAYAHLVAFDPARSGFAHLHPDGGSPLDTTVLPPRPDPAAAVLRFQALFPRPGDYVLWAQVRLDGRDRFLPFRLSVPR
jgi:hypothetical protein